MDSESKIVRCFEKACEDVGLSKPDPQTVKDIIGLSLAGALERLLPGVDPQTRDKVVERYREHFIHLDDTEMGFFPGVLSGLQQLRDWGYWLAVATGKARRGLDKLLDEWELHKHFVSTRCADETFSKPHPQMLLDILEHTGLQADQAVMVGDTVYDMQMAQQANMARIAVGYGVQAMARLKTFEPCQCFDDFNPLLEWFSPNGS